MTDPATKPCEFCRNGTVTDSNGAAWRCAHCNGTGRVRVETEGTEDDDMPFRKRYRTIVADPPWPMAWGGGGKTRRKGDGTVYYNANTTVDELPYRTMSIEDIAAIEVDDIAESGAHLYVWTTDQHLLDGSATRVITAWGFKPERTIVWRKANYGMGHGWRPAHELVIFARRGRLPLNSHSTATVGDWKQPYVKTGGSVAKLHSAKPEAFLDVVEMLSPGPYLEMFARRARFGWDYYGDQSLGTAEMAA